MTSLSYILNLIGLLKYAQLRKINSKSKIIKAGFTLVELALVLVIIGLLVGGVLVGQDLIYAAKVRAQVKQIEEIETGMNTFRTKYNCKAGDCPNATDFFGATDAQGYTIINGDGDGIVKGNHSGGTIYTAGECLLPDVTDEVSQALLQLNDAGFGKYFANGNSANAFAAVGIVFPYTAFGNGTGVYITCLSSPTYVYTPTFLNSGNVVVVGSGGYSTSSTAAGRIMWNIGSRGIAIGAGYGLEAGMGNVNPIGLPMEALRQIDIKIDDGMPNSGKFGIIVADPATCGHSNLITDSLSTYPTNLSTYSTCLGTGGKKID
jgi:prepilin-type N-terminal cleavage/methylation domain-containing protein